MNKSSKVEKNRSLKGRMTYKNQKGLWKQKFFNYMNCQQSGSPFQILLSAHRTLSAGRGHNRDWINPCGQKTSFTN